MAFSPLLPSSLLVDNDHDDEKGEDEEEDVKDIMRTCY
jgi:hypothetical protein